VVVVVVLDLQPLVLLEEMEQAHFLVMVVQVAQVVAVVVQVVHLMLEPQATVAMAVTAVFLFTTRR
jgi:hypothetical protein